MAAPTTRKPSPQLVITVDAAARSLLLTTINGAAPVESDDPRLLLTIRETAERLSMGRSFVQALVTRGTIPSVKLGKSRRVSLNALRTYLAKLEAEADA